MKVLFVCSINSGVIRPFIKEQVDSIESTGVVCDYYLVKGKGIGGYLKNYFPLVFKIIRIKPDIIHAHYGLSGLLTVLTFRRPVIITFHGSDINNKKVRILSRLADRLCNASIFVTNELADLIKSKKRNIIPCGISDKKFNPVSKNEARALLGLKEGKRYILFSSSFSNPVKNYSLASKAIKLLNDKNIELLEFNGYSGEQINLLYNAVDSALMTSFNEGSPQFIKEAMMCNCPIVSTEVGDVKELLAGVKGCYICNYDPENVAEKIKLSLEFSQITGRTNGNSAIYQTGLDDESITGRILKIYDKVLIDK
jgi:teichuronic acid biosynthesis glycosyltransferase TuaC